MLNDVEYREATRKRDWKKIFEINKVAMDSFGTKKEFLALGGLIEEDETVYAFASGIVSKSETSNTSDFGANTWLVALTSERFLFVDCALLSNSVDTQTVRLNRVQAVSASQGWVLGKIMVDIGSRTITVDNCQKAHAKIVAELANRLLRERDHDPVVTSLNDPAKRTDLTSSPTAQTGLDALERLAALRTSGALTDEEFSAAKARILAAL
ncbi:PH domain-containing protein [Tabrizicola sp. J26]|uniref:PH domain-containing protein n=1 Tax=Alitabrizicola rongguiensis TaxID=2909234 RepID=UPI001F341B21|nr:PH domain-containing protein [Tabrizicola rongguiensis]MCF1711158.1 PH domain-containing protein [Tabrizicola rongguiensis]